MDNKVLEDIVNYAANKLNQNYGFCGVAKGSEAAMLNSSDGKGNDIVINITIKPE